MFSNQSYHKIENDSSRSDTGSNKDTTGTQAKITMKVKEFRNWLSDSHYKNKTNKKIPERNRPYLRIDTLEQEAGLLGIESKPSSTSTTPSTDCEEKDDLFSSDSGTEDEMDHSTTVDYYSPVGDKFVESTIASDNHIGLLKLQAPTMQKEEGYLSAQSSFSEDDSEKFSEGIVGASGTFRHPEKIAESKTSPSLFGKQLITKATLDAMSEIDPSKPKTLGEKLEALKEEHDQRQLSVDFTSSTSSGKTSDGPSIAPGALVSKMAGIFLKSPGPRTPSLASVERRRYVDPKELDFLQPSFKCPKRVSFHTKEPERTTPVGKGIRKFGGPRKSLIEKRKEQLQERYADNRPAVFVKKDTWAQKGAHGSYQRRTVVEKVFVKNAYK